MDCAHIACSEFDVGPADLLSSSLCHPFPLVRSPTMCPSAYAYASDATTVTPTQSHNSTALVKLEAPLRLVEISPIDSSIVIITEPIGSSFGSYRVKVKHENATDTSKQKDCHEDPKPRRWSRWTQGNFRKRKFKNRLSLKSSKNRLSLRAMMSKAVPSKRSTTKACDTSSSSNPHQDVVGMELGQVPGSELKSKEPINMDCSEHVEVEVPLESNPIDSSVMVFTEPIVSSVKPGSSLVKTHKETDTKANPASKEEKRPRFLSRWRHRKPLKGKNRLSLKSSKKRFSLRSMVSKATLANTKHSIPDTSSSSNSHQDGSGLSPGSGPQKKDSNDSVEVEVSLETSPINSSHPIVSSVRHTLGAVKANEETDAFDTPKEEESREGPSINSLYDETDTEDDCTFTERECQEGQSFTSHLGTFDTSVEDECQEGPSRNSLYEETDSEDQEELSSYYPRGAFGMALSPLPQKRDSRKRMDVGVSLGMSGISPTDSSIASSAKHTLDPVKIYMENDMPTNDKSTFKDKACREDQRLLSQLRRGKSLHHDNRLSLRSMPNASRVDPDMVLNGMAEATSHINEINKEHKKFARQPKMLQRSLRTLKKNGKNFVGTFDGFLPKKNGGKTRSNDERRDRVMVVVTKGTGTSVASTGYSILKDANNKSLGWAPCSSILNSDSTPDMDAQVSHTRPHNWNKFSRAHSDPARETWRRHNNWHSSIESGCGGARPSRRSRSAPPPQVEFDPENLSDISSDSSAVFRCLGPAQGVYGGSKLFFNWEHGRMLQSPSPRHFARNV